MLVKILYIWVENYPLCDSPHFNKQGFNFSSKYRFQFDHSSLLLNADLNKKHIKDFYKTSAESKISELTCIVGMNGAGKTLLLELIRFLLVQGFSETRVFKAAGSLVIWEKNEKLYYDWSGKTEIKLASIENTPPLLKGNLQDFKTRTEIVSYSNFFDHRYEESSQMEGCTNISTNFLINHYSISLRENLQYKNGPDKVSTYRREELNNFLSFFSKYYDTELSMKFPCKFIGFSVHDNQFHDGRKKRYEESFGSFFANVQKVQYYLESQINSAKKNEFDFFAWQAIRSYWLLYLDALTEYRNFINTDFELPNLPNTYEKFGKDFLIEFSRKILPPELVVGKEVVSNKFLDEFVTKITFFTEFLDFLKYAFAQSSTRYYPSQPIFVSIQSELEKTRNALEKYFASIYLVGDYISFDWSPQLSSGQKAFLTLFSRLYYVVELSKKFSNKKLPENLIILIDEGEISFHPQWQKEYIKTLLQWTDKIFDSENCEKNKSIQLIITTNTPLLLSDIIRENAIFIDKGVVDEDDYKTFSANISDLYLEPFFIHDGLVGNFAKDKIEKVFHLLKQRRLNSDETEFISSLLEHINDDFVRGFLKSKFEEKQAQIK
ncbi:MAG: hypothetical protein C0412_10320 [Flavobacterium sp.]|nr:hypothetical protein [Flavobacterium sp.]